MHDADLDDMPFLSPVAKTHMDGLRKEGLIVKRDTNIRHKNNSPLYYTIRFILILYLIVFVTTVLYTVFDLNFCYLQAPIHRVRIKNTSIPTENPGLIFNPARHNTSQGTNNYLDGYIKDTEFVAIETYGLVRGKPFKSIEDQSNYLININRANTTERDVHAFPMAIVLRNINSISPDDTICLATLTFSTFPQSSVRPTDGGIASSIDVLNPNRKRIWITPLWYNFGYWTSNDTIYRDNRFNETEKKTYNIPNLTNVPKTRYYCTSQVTNILPSQYNKSNVPIWFMDFADASAARLSGRLCNDNYGVTFRLATWYCISPLLIYDLRLTTIEFQNITFNGNLILDFRTDSNTLATYMQRPPKDPYACFRNGERTMPRKLTLRTSTINIMTLTKDIKELVIDNYGVSSFTFTIPKRVLTCDKSVNISLNATNNDATKEPCRLEFSGIAGETTYSGDFRRFYAARYIAPLDKIQTLKITVNFHNNDTALSTALFCNKSNNNKVITFPLKVHDSRSNAIFALDYVKDADIKFDDTSTSNPTSNYFKAEVTCDGNRSLVLALTGK